jgi:hypothetical protein
MKKAEKAKAKEEVVTLPDAVAPEELIPHEASEAEKADVTTPPEVTPEPSDIPDVAPSDLNKKKADDVSPNTAKKGKKPTSVTKTKGRTKAQVVAAQKLDMRMFFDDDEEFAEFQKNVKGALQEEKIRKVFSWWKRLLQVWFAAILVCSFFGWNLYAPLGFHPSPPVTTRAPVKKLRRGVSQVFTAIAPHDAPRKKRKRRVSTHVKELDAESATGHAEAEHLKAFLEDPTQFKKRPKKKRPKVKKAPPFNDNPMCGGPPPPMCGPPPPQSGGCGGCGGPPPPFAISELPEFMFK